jgi:hypothetical protein
MPFPKPKPNCLNGATTSDPDIFRAPKLAIDQHGADAGIRAAERRGQLLEAGDMIGAAT